MAVLQQPQAKIQQLKEKLSLARKMARTLRSSKQEIVESRALWRNKYYTEHAAYQALMLQYKALESKPNKAALVANERNIAGHKYSEFIVKLCVTIYISTHCGFRGVVNILTYLNLVLELELNEIPCKSSIENWVQKAGYYAHTHIDMARYTDGYALIIDESMTVGAEQLLAILIVPANKRDSVSLTLAAIEVVHLEVKRGWVSADIAKCIQKVEEKMTFPATYIISDGAANMHKSVELAGRVRIYDVGHEMARLVRRIYEKQDDFCLFLKACALVKQKEVMKVTHYIAPPKQRREGRYLNLSPVVDWAVTMLRVLPTLNDNERKIFGFVMDYESIIKEMNQVFSLVNETLKPIKTDGLSYTTIAMATTLWTQKQTIQTAEFTRLQTDITTYLANEKAKLPNDKTVWHASSDIIESMFGTYKSREASAPSHGVTPFVLFLPLLSKNNAEKNTIDINFSTALESVSMADLKHWSDTQLIENQLVKRRKIFKN
jgi:hypothetical protein